MQLTRRVVLHTWVRQYNILHRKITHLSAVQSAGNTSINHALTAGIFFIEHATLDLSFKSLTRGMHAWNGHDLDVGLKDSIFLYSNVPQKMKTSTHHVLPPRSLTKCDIWCVGRWLPMTGHMFFFEMGSHVCLERYLIVTSVGGQNSTKSTQKYS
jgi:hypothetical protein